MCIFDPMYNLLLGTAKHMLSVWIDLNLLSSSNFKDIQDRVDSFFTPEDVGCIRTKIASGFSADEWHNWTIIFSLSCLKDILPHNHYNCWQLFVKACYLLCRCTIILDQLHTADQFCKSFKQQFTLWKPINLHLHAHLSECILDYGPVYSFWLFPFECLNGVLGSFHTNCHDISLQLIRRFLDTHEFGTHTWPVEYRDELSHVILRCVYNKGSLMQSSLEHLVRSTDLHVGNIVEPLPPVRESALEPHQQLSVLSSIHSAKMIESNDPMEVIPVFQRCGALKIGGVIIGSESGRHQPYLIVMVYSLNQADGAKVVKGSNKSHIWVCST